jgi:hypothetical protein
MAKFYNNDAHKETRVNNTTQLCVEHVYNSIDLSRFRYELLEFKNELPQLLEKKYYVSPNFSGSNCLLVFSKIKDKYYQFLIDRKTLSYNSKKINYDMIKLMYVDIKLDINIYKDRGSIFDGVLIQNNNKKIFIITDVYMFKGQDTIDTPINLKLLSVSTYFNSTYKKDKNNDMRIMINDLYELDEIDTLINNKIPENKEFLIKGICFFPEHSGTKKIFMFDNKSRSNNITNDKKLPQKTNNTPLLNNSSNKNQTNPNQQIQQNITPNIKPVQNNNPPQKSSLDPQMIISTIKKEEKMIYMPKPGKMDTEYVFEMKKTDIIDVYNLYIVEPTIKDGRTLLKRIKTGLAFVSGLERSKWCQEVMNECNGSTLVNCKFHDEKQKWEPICIAKDAKKPSLVNDFVIV